MEVPSNASRQECRGGESVASAFQDVEIPILKTVVGCHSTQDRPRLEIIP